MSLYHVADTSSVCRVFFFKGPFIRIESSVKIFPACIGATITTDDEWNSKIKLAHRLKRRAEFDQSWITTALFTFDSKACFSLSAVENIRKLLLLYKAVYFIVLYKMIYAFVGEVICIVLVLA